jgi:acyl-CoA thioester hydrolase
VTADPLVARISRRIPPRQCDAQGMLHASRPAEHFEDALLAWLDAACGGYGALRDAGVDLVMVASSIQYLAPARLDDEVGVDVVASGRGRSSLQLSFAMTRQGDVLVTATHTYVVVGASGSEPIPAVLERGLDGVGPIDRARS